MITWEYDYLNDPSLSALNQAGQEGWELVGWHDERAWLKRPTTGHALETKFVPETTPDGD